MDGTGRLVERLFGWVYTRLAFLLLLMLPVWLRFVLPEDTAIAVGLAHGGVLWGLLTAWLGYKVVQTLRGAPAAA